MLYPLDDTIVAISSAHHTGAPRGILRASGPNVFHCFLRAGVKIPDEIFCHKFKPHAFSAILPIKRMHSTAFIPLPGMLYLWPEGHSYTGSASCEFHTLGSIPLLERALETLCSHGARLAQPGEFTLRAFLSGRLDLTQAEAVLGVINATTQKTLDVALNQLAGGLTTPLHSLRDTLFTLLGHLEAGMDFTDEDIQFISTEELVSQLKQVACIVETLLSRMTQRRDADALPRVVLYGPPNVGKSSLFNALTGSHALVYDQPGTTRDYLCARLNLPGGSACLLTDTAGDITWNALNTEHAEERTSTDHFFRVHPEITSDSVSGTDDLDLHRDPSVEHMADKIALREEVSADLRILCVDRSSLEQMAALINMVTASPTPHVGTVFSNARKAENDSHLKDNYHPFNARTLVVLTHAGESNSPLSEFQQRQLDSISPVETSILTGRGLNILSEEIERRINSFTSGDADVVSATALRCRETLLDIRDSLKRAILLTSETYPELIAAEIRSALNNLGIMVGAIYTEDLLDSIFSRFCVGK